MMLTVKLTRRGRDDLSTARSIIVQQAHVTSSHTRNERVLSEQVVHRSEQVAPNPKEILDESMHRQESLRVPG